MPPPPSRNSTPTASSPASICNWPSCPRRAERGLSRRRPRRRASKHAERSEVSPDGDPAVGRKPTAERSEAEQKRQEKRKRKRRKSGVALFSSLSTCVILCVFPHRAHRAHRAHNAHRAHCLRLPPRKSHARRAKRRRKKNRKKRRAMQGLSRRRPRRRAEGDR